MKTKSSFGRERGERGGGHLENDDEERDAAHGDVHL